MKLNFKDFFKKNKIKNETLSKEMTLDEFFKEIKKDDKNHMNESTYFICLKVLSEALGKLPLKAYKRTEKGGKEEYEHPAIEILSKRPNPYTTASVFWSTVEMHRNHYGNAYVYLHFDNAKNLKGLYILDNEKVKPLIDNAGKLSQIVNKVYYRYADGRIFDSDDILHFRTSLTGNGITGLSVREQLANMLSFSKESEKYLKNLYENGLMASGVLEYTADLKDDAVNKLLSKLSIYGSGVKKVGGVIPIPPGTSLKPLTLTLSDSQFIENKKFTSQQIAGAFGVKPYLLNDYSSGGYNSNEYQSLSFYVDTLMFNLKHYEEELEYKILNKHTDKGVFFRFNEKAILRVSAKEQMEILKDGVNNAIYTPNEARNFLQFDSIEGGDVLICNGNYIPVTDVGNQYRNTNSKIEREEEKDIDKKTVDTEHEEQKSD